MALIFNNDGLAYTASSDPGAFVLLGGRYASAITATFGGGSVILNELMPDGTTYVALTPAYGSNAGTVAGTAVFDLPPGTYKYVITTATSVQVSLIRVPYRAA